jgi:lactate permease
MPWSQGYNPLQNSFLSTLVALLPALILLACLGIFRLKAHLAALAGLSSALLIAVLIFGMPLSMGLVSAGYGIVYGLMPIGWIILNVIYLYRLADRRGLFKIIQDNLTAITGDRRLQLLLVAFCFGAFFEGAAGFGTPVAVTASILIGLGFTPLIASGLSLIANTAPVPYAALGAPILALQAITGLDLHALSSMVAKQLVIFDVLIPFWLIAVFAGWQGMLEVWPALLVAGGSFALVQYFVATLHGPWLVNIASSLVSLGVLVLFLKHWQPRRIWKLASDAPGTETHQATVYTRQQVMFAWLPWLILSVVVFVWGLPQIKAWLDGFSAIHAQVPGLHLMVLRTPPVVAQPHPEAAIYDFTWLSANGTAILIAALASGFVLKYSFVDLVKEYLETIRQVRFSLLTIAFMMAIGYVTRYAGLDATLGLAFARSGVLYPFFGTLLGWFGVVVTGSDTSSNVLFGSLQRITAEQLRLDPVMMASANSSGGVMGKMMNAQSIVVASTATGWYGHEGNILRYVFLHSLGLASLVGIVVILQAYVFH